MPIAVKAFSMIRCVFSAAQLPNVNTSFMVSENSGKQGPRSDKARDELEIQIQRM